MSDLYPLKFKTIYKDKIWGGQKIRTVLNKDFGQLPNCGETWEISGVKGNISTVSEGRLQGQDLEQILKEHKANLVGEKVYNRYGNEFPLLVKFIDANDDLSVQVHPNDALAMKRHASFGKTEMWYIFQADVFATLNSGFNRPLTKEEYLEYFNHGKLMDILNIEKVQADDVYFLPAGRVHYIGKGCLLAEIQQSSDVTYRIYDFDRKDDQGQARELHTEQSIDAIDFTYQKESKTQYIDKVNEVVPLVSCPYFTTNKLHFNEAVSRDFSSLDSFVIYVCMSGELTMDYGTGSTSLKTGEAILVPASIKKINLKPRGWFKMLESYIA
ncbi:MAG: type I phosphomannose isomerase catalytic subunit [Cyclobacteriaceae bacterium]|nr:type I phosphomannose isomerase catalytic subunit [Cyclobacteriaceae bacterium]